MKRNLLTIAMLLSALLAQAANHTISSPDGRLQVTISDNGQRPTYQVSYDGLTALDASALGFEADFGNFTKAMRITAAKDSTIDRTYTMRQTKCASAHYVARCLRLTLQNAEGQQMDVVFQVSDNNVAFRYDIPRPEASKPKVGVISREATAFSLPPSATTFLCPQITPMSGWERTKPSYEEEYTADAPLQASSRFKQGYTFPCLFRIPVATATSGKKGKAGGSGDNLWVLVSETGVDGTYPGSHLSDYQAATGYTIAFPQPGENNSLGQATAGVSLPYATPWRTITVGKSLKPIVETTISYDVVEQRYEPSQQYKGGRYTWSWLVWQDESINYDDQVKFIDLAAAMGYEYCLVDNWWDQRIGRSRMAHLADYARSKGVSLMLWYNSNGTENDAPQTPRDRMATPMARDAEMDWLRSIGVKGIKVDFFGGDKQQTMQLYEDILYDANRYGLQVIFHGCTIPRGWEVMYPNYVASEAVLASENVYFTEHHAKTEAFELTLHPFCRNAVGTMDWGGTIMNKYLARDNKSRHPRHTTDIFEMASAITNQTAIQCIALQPNNLTELPQMELDFLRRVPTTWEETRFVEGYPGRYVVLARRHNNAWYVAGLNAETQPRTLTIALPELAGTTLSYYYDDPKDGPQLKQVKADKRGQIKVCLQPNGGIIVCPTR